MLFPLIGEGLSGENIGTAGLTAALVIILREVVPYLFQWRKAKREESEADREQRRKDEEADRQRRKEDRDDSVAHMERLLDRAEAAIGAKDRQLEAKDKQIESLTRTANRATIRAERAVVWIQHLEATLRTHKVPFSPWEDEDDNPEPAVSKSDAETDVGADGGYP